MIKRSINSQSGFSLIELLVAMGIIAVLTGMASFNFNQSRVRARDVQRKNDLSQLQKALELYKNDHRVYPVTDMQNTLLDLPAKANQYIRTTFNDPKGSTEWIDYQYKPAATGKTYYLMACLENLTDQTKATDINVCANFKASVSDCTCGPTTSQGAGVMYIVTQP
jgi:prepilin-type N-terminal cleavage/methylation domain-containing protein